MTSHGLRSRGLLAKQPTIGLTMVLLGGLTFAFLAYELKTNQAFFQWDLTMAKAFRALQIKAPWSLMENILFGCFLGKEVVVLIGTSLAVYFLHKRFWRELAMILTGLGGGGLIWFVLSRYFERPRPADHLDVLELAGPSFPSAPALLAVLCYGLLAYLLIPRLPSLFWKWFTALMATAAIVLVALSSLLFGTHYATDVIAGIALGLAWAGLAYTLIERIFRGETVSDRVDFWEPIDFEGFRAPGFFKRRPIVGFAVVLLTLLSLGVLGYNLLAQGPLVEVDMSVYKALLSKARAATPDVNDMMLFGFFVGKQLIQVITATLSLYFLSQRYWRELAMLQLSSLGGGLIWNFLINYFSRPRPPEQMGLVITELPSFPSGHALGTMICYGFLAYLLVDKMPSLFWKWVAGIVILLLILFEGFSRIFHANHYLTDVLAGYALGIACLVLVCTLIEGIFIKGKN
jgi:membrane-associated phospholipid phosphatase